MAKLYNDTALPDSDLKFTDCEYTGQFLETETGLNAVYYHDGKLYYFGKFTQIPHQIEHEGILKMHKESRIMANKITVLGLFHNPDTLLGYARVTIDSNMVIHCRLYGGNKIIRFKSMRKAQECLEKIAGHSLRFTTL